MKLVKKVLALSCAAVLGLSLAACGGGSSESAASSAAEQDCTVPQADEVKEYVREFTVQGRSVKVLAASEREIK